MPVTLPERIVQRIVADYLDSGLLKPGDKLPSIRALQQQYGTSNATLAHALSNLDAQGLVRKVHGKGCFVADKAGEDRVVQAATIGYVAPLTPHELLVQAYAGIERTCTEHGYHVVVASTNWDYEHERSVVTRLVEGGCAGIVLCPAARRGSQLRRDYLKRLYLDFPMVLLDIAYPEQGRSQVVFDNYRAGLQMTRSLIRAGHERIAFIQLFVPEDEFMHRPVMERYRGYCDALRRAGLGPRQEDQWRLDVSMPDTTPRLRELLASWKEADARATAVITPHDGNAVALMDIGADMGVEVPADLEVVGFDHLSVGRSVRPEFRTTRPDFELAGETASELLIKQINGEVRKQVVYMLPVPLVRTGARAGVRQKEREQHALP